jgi:integron integrase
MPDGRGLFEVAREKIRTRHLAFRTEQAYLQWMRRYVNFHGRKHPRDMGSAEVEAFLVEAKVAASTQNQALQALLFLYRHVLDVDLPWLENVTRASRPKRLPVVLSSAEVRSVLAQLDGTCWLMANLLYGSGLRLMEAHRLRVKDLILDRGELIVRDAKGGKDRVTVLPTALIAPVREHLTKLFDRFRRQRKLREPGVSLPTAIARKYPNAATEWGWQWVFPASSLCRDVYTGLPTRHHQHEKTCSITGYSVIRLLWLYYAGSPDIFSFNFSELLWPTPHHQIRTSSIPLVWCWAS